MSTAATPFLDQDLYVPSYKVILLGQKLGPEVVRDITSVTYKDSIDQIDSFEIALSNWDSGQSTYQDIKQRKYKYSDQDLFDPGKKIELWMGYYGANDTNLRKMLTGEITSLRPSFPASGQPTLAVSGQNLLHTLRREPVSAAYTKKKDSQIAAEIAKRLNIDFTPDPAA